jgi:hypothetical protein
MSSQWATERALGTVAAVCTVFLRLRPGAAWPVVVAAVRDEFVDRPWDPPARHWDTPYDRLVGGVDRTAGGTWLAVDPERKALAALLNGARPAHEIEEIQRRGTMPDPGVRPTRGTLPLRALTSGGVPDDVSDYDRFHLLLVEDGSARLWSWDGEALTESALVPGDHIVVNEGLDVDEDPLVPHFAPLIDAIPDDGGLDEQWSRWKVLLRGDGLAGDDDRALIVRREILERDYGSTSATLVAMSDAGVRYEFTADPADPAWTRIEV